LKNTCFLVVGAGVKGWVDAGEVCQGGGRPRCSSEVRDEKGRDGGKILPVFLSCGQALRVVVSPAVILYKYVLKLCRAGVCENFVGGMRCRVFPGASSGAYAAGLAGPRP